VTEAARAHRPAATVIVLCDTAAGPEVFMVRRHEATAFMGGAWVFPGGRVDTGDAAVADPSWCDGLDSGSLPGLTPEASVAHRLAAVRELFEEANVLLARDAPGRFVSTSDPAAHDRFAQDRRDIHAGTRSLRDVAERERLRLALDVLVPFARWQTPPVDSRQFDAWFFMTLVPPAQAPRVDELETTHGAWLKPADALARATAGEITLPPPTWTTLREIESFPTVADALGWAAARRIEPREPLLHEADGERFLLLPGDPLNPQPWHEPPPQETRFRLVAGRWTPERP